MEEVCGEDGGQVRVDVLQHVVRVGVDRVEDAAHAAAAPVLQEVHAEGEVAKALLKRRVTPIAVIIGSELELLYLRLKEVNEMRTLKSSFHKKLICGFL